MNLQSIFQSQQVFFRSQQTKDLAFRKRELLKLKGLLKANEEKLYGAIYEDFAKSKFDTYTTELSIMYSEIDYFLKNISRLSKPEKIKTNMINFPGKSRIYYEPLGCTLIIGAWNYPYQLTLLPVITAVAAGNTCIIKPSELPANTMNIMAEIINNNFPPEFLYVVQGGVEETTELLKFPYDKIFFTGSPKVGRIVYEAAARNLTPVTLELGGKSPVIVTKSADLRIAAKRIVWGKFLNAGQTCIAPDYLLVEECVRNRLLELIGERIGCSNYVDGSDNYVKIINKRNFERVVKMIDSTKVVYGGGFNQDTLYIQPTIMDNVGWDDAVMQEEIFGPVLPVIGFTDFEKALEKILSFEKPLSAYLFSNDERQKRSFTSKISFGGGCINDTIMHIANDKLPFGGVGNSGIGNYHGKFGFMAFSHQKAVFEKPNKGEFDLKYPPYTESKKKWVDKLV
ncbi:MAG: aldehyde dehydrogenase [Rikenellaceae bacterium]|nr:aldehyde dehydrogenase [Rikenellaceae bacterium]